jgi:mRNA-degrading endonuclease toxin of MazEF toxin-antitoxin module
MSESKITLQLTTYQVSVLAASLTTVVAITTGRTSYETRVVLEEICQQSGLDARAMCEKYESAAQPRKWWKR